jgi:hypothetical protein
VSVSLQKANEDLVLQVLQNNEGPTDINSMRHIDYRYSVVLFVDRKPIAIAGVTPIFEKTGEVWSFFTEEVLSKYPISLTKAAKSFIKECFESGEFLRITAVTPNDKLHVHWLEILGFEVEGILKNFGPNAQGDYALMGRI